MTMGKVMTYTKAATNTLRGWDAEGNYRDTDVTDVRACQQEWEDFNQLLIDEGDDITPPMPAESLQNDIDLFDALSIETDPTPPVAHDTLRVAYYGVMATCRSYPMQRVPV